MSAEDAEDAFGAGGGSEFDDDFGLDDTGGSAEDAQDAAAGGGEATDDATPDAGGSDTGTGFDDGDDGPGLDQTPSFGGGAAGGNDPGAPTDRGDETPSNSGRSSDPVSDRASPDDDTGSREPSTDEVPTFDGRRTRLSGEDAPGNTTDTTTATVLDEAGDEGARVFPEDDDPLVVDDGRGLEDRGVGGVPAPNAPASEPTTPAEQARADAVERLQGRVDREVPGVRAIDTSAYNIVPADGGGLRVELTDQGVEQVREATDDGDQADRGGVRTAEQAGRTPVDPALRDDPQSGEAAADAFARGGLTAPIPVGQADSSEAAADLVGSGTVAPAPVLVSGDTRRDPTLNRAVRQQQRREQFGDVDASLGFGGPEDEVERFLDNDLATLLDPAAGGVPADQEEPPGPGSGPVGLSPTAALAVEPELVESDRPTVQGVSDTVRGLDDIPGLVLEGTEAGLFLTEATPAAGGSEQQFDRRLDEFEREGGRRAGAVVEFGQENPVRFITSVAAASVLEGGAIGLLGRLGSAGRLASSGTATRRGAARAAVGQTADEATDAGARVSARTSAVRERGPDVSVRSDADAPVLEVDPLLRQQLRDRFIPEGGASTTTRDVFGRPLRADSAGRGVTNRPPLTDTLREGVPDTAAGVAARIGDLREDLAPTGAASTTTRDVFGRPTSVEQPGRVRAEVDRATDILPSGAASTTTRDVFGRPATSEPVSLLPRASVPSGRRDVFGAPLATDVGATPLSARLGGLLGGSASTTSRDVFGRPLATDVGATPLSTRVGGVFGGFGGAGTTSRDVFGTPLAPDAGAVAVSQRADDLLSTLRETPGRAREAAGAASIPSPTVRIGPVRPRRTIDVGRVDDEPIGPFAPDDLDGFDPVGEVFDLDGGGRRAGDGGDGGTGQVQATRRRARGERPPPEADTDRVVDDPNRALAAGVAGLGGVLLPGLGVRAQDPLVGALNRVRVAQSPAATANTPGRPGLFDVGAGLAPLLEDDQAAGALFDEALSPELDVGTRRDLGRGGRQAQESEQRRQRRLGLLQRTEQRREQELRQESRRRLRLEADLDPDGRRSRRPTDTEALVGPRDGEPGPLRPNAISELFAAFSGAGAEGRRGVRGDERTVADETIGLPVAAQDTEAFEETTAFLGFGEAGASGEPGVEREPARDDGFLDVLPTVEDDQDDEDDGLLSFAGGLL